MFSHYIHSQSHCTQYLTFVVMTTYNHWGVSKIYFQNIMRNVTHTDKFYKLHKIASTAVAGWHTL